MTWGKITDISNFIFNPFLSTELKRRRKNYIENGETGKVQGRKKTEQDGRSKPVSAEGSDCSLSVFQPLPFGA